MKDFWLTLIASTVIAILVFVLISLTDKPVVYRSASTEEVVKAEYKGVEIPLDQVGDRYEIVNVE